MHSNWCQQIFISEGKFYNHIILTSSNDFPFGYISKRTGKCHKLAVKVVNFIDEFLEFQGQINLIFVYFSAKLIVLLCVDILISSLAKALLCIQRDIAFGMVNWATDCSSKEVSEFLFPS